MSFKLIIFYYYLKYKFFMKIGNKEKLLSFQKRKIKKHLNYITKKSGYYSEYRGKELKDFKKEVYQLFEKNTREIATVINQLSESISTKNHRNSEETKQRLEKNDKEHRIYEAQIAKLQLTTQYLEEKGKKLA